MRSLFTVALLLSVWSAGAVADFSEVCATTQGAEALKTLKALFLRVGEKTAPSEESCQRVGEALQARASLDLSGRGLKDLSIVKELWWLQVLNISGNPIENAEFLLWLGEIRALVASNVGLTDLSHVGELKTLKHLDLTQNQIGDVGALRGLQELNALFLTQNQITSVEALGVLRNLETLWIGENAVTDLSPLKDLINLRALSVLKNPVKDYTVLAALELTHENDAGEFIKLEIVGKPAISKPIVVPCPTPCPCPQPVPCGYGCGSYPVHVRPGCRR